MWDYLIERETETILDIQLNFEHLCQLFEKHILRYFHYSCCYLLKVSLSLSRQCLWNHSNTQVCRLSDFHLRTFLGVAHLPKLARGNDLSLSVFDWTHLTSVWVPLSLHRPLLHQQPLRSFHSHDTEDRPASTAADARVSTEVDSAAGLLGLHQPEAFKVTFVRCCSRDQKQFHFGGSGSLSLGSE